MTDYKLERNFFGDGYTIYDEHRRKVGKSERNFFGDGYTNYDNKGNRIGTSEKNFFGNGYTHYDIHRNKIGTSELSLWGDSFVNYDKYGKKTGTIDRDMRDGEFDEENNEGCYIATSVYGSYDCPEVWVLRRFRDYVLYEHILGRAFIKVYYAISPICVKLFGNMDWFRNVWKYILDKLIIKLKKMGYEDTQYDDRF